MTTHQRKRYDLRDTTLKFVTGPDVLDFLWIGSDEDICAEMSCGCAVTPQTLTEECQRQLEKGKFKFKCPECEEQWSYREVCKMALLTAEEKAYFEEKMARLAATEYCEFQTVHDRCVNDGCINDGCINDGCINPELELLKNCKTTALPQVVGVTACPSIRACPTCGQRGEHDTTGSKFIICPRCQVEFCFVCLKLTPECLQTSSYFLPCSAGVAPRQTSIPVWHRN